MELYLKEIEINRTTKTSNWLGLETIGCLTDYAQNLPGHCRISCNMGDGLFVKVKCGM